MKKTMKLTVEIDINYDDTTHDPKKILKDLTTDIEDGYVVVDEYELVRDKLDDGFFVFKLKGVEIE